MFFSTKPSSTIITASSHQTKPKYYLINPINPKLHTNQNAIQLHLHHEPPRERPRSPSFPRKSHRFATQIAKSPDPDTTANIPQQEKRDVVVMNFDPSVNIDFLKSLCIGIAVCNPVTVGDGNNVNV